MGERREDWCEGYVKEGEICESEGDQESTSEAELCFDSKGITRFGGKLTVSQLLLWRIFFLYMKLS